MINRAQKEWNEPRVDYAGGDTSRVPQIAGLDVRIEKADGEGTRFTLVLPYTSIWMKAHGEKFETSLEVTMKVRDAAGAEAWSFAKSFPLEVPVSRLKEMAKTAFTADAVASLGPGSYTLTVDGHQHERQEQGLARTGLRDLNQSLAVVLAAAAAWPLRAYSSERVPSPSRL